MIYKSFKEAELFENGKNKTYEYNIEDKDINYCIADINGRSPQKGFVVNHKCKEMIHVLSGGGILFINGKTFHLKQDDVVLIQPEEKYYFEGKMRLGIPCTPAWFPEQHEEIE